MSICLKLVIATPNYNLTRLIFQKREIAYPLVADNCFTLSNNSNYNDDACCDVDFTGLSRTAHRGVAVSPPACACAQFVAYKYSKKQDRTVGLHAK